MVQFWIKDCKLIDQANELIKGQGDGRLSGKDMALLLENEITSDEQKETLMHIITNYKLTESAKTVLLSRIMISKN
tara:strand:- start:469 stop:696 length:228 start_codon:yes stop_codon:yes gene_type:complete